MRKREGEREGRERGGGEGGKGELIILGSPCYYTQEIPSVLVTNMAHLASSSSATYGKLFTTLHTIIPPPTQPAALGPTPLPVQRSPPQEHSSPNISPISLFSSSPSTDNIVFLQSLIDLG